MIIDLVVLAALVVSAGIAFFRGFIREVLTIFGVAGGLFAAFWGAPHLKPIVNGWLGTEEAEEMPKLFGILPYDMLADIISYGSIFLIVVIVLSIFSHLLAGWARAIGLGAIDRTLGVIFGIARGIFILALLYLPVFLMVEKETREGWFENSKTHVYIAATAEWMSKFVPDDMSDDLQDKAEDTGASMAKATREKLQEMDILGGNTSSEKPSDDSAETPESTDGGYEQDERLDIQKLIGQELQQQLDGNTGNE